MRFVWSCLLRASRIDPLRGIKPVGCEILFNASKRANRNSHPTGFAADRSGWSSQVSAAEVVLYVGGNCRRETVQCVSVGFVERCLPESHQIGEQASGVVEMIGRPPLGANVVRIA